MNNELLMTAIPLAGLILALIILALTIVIDVQIRREEKLLKEEQQEQMRLDEYVEEKLNQDWSL